MRKLSGEKVYTGKVAAAINTLQIKGWLTEAEMISLLDLLDCLVLKESPQLLQALQEFLSFPNSELTHELDEIVKATLLATDFKNPEAIKQAIDIINEMTSEKNRLYNSQ
ncbi:MAG: hypothetical protein ACM3MK_13470 [Chitinophagales bacterium]